MTFRNFVHIIRLFEKVKCSLTYLFPHLCLTNTLLSFLKIEAIPFEELSKYKSKEFLYMDGCRPNVLKIAPEG